MIESREFNWSEVKPVKVFNISKDGVISEK